MLIFTQCRVKGYVIAPDETQIAGPRLGLRVTSGERERDEGKGERGEGSRRGFSALGEFLTLP